MKRRQREKVLFQVHAYIDNVKQGSGSGLIESRSSKFNEFGSRSINFQQFDFKSSLKSKKQTKNQV